MPQGGTCPQNRIRKHLKYQYRIFKTKIILTPDEALVKKKIKIFRKNFAPQRAQKKRGLRR